MKTLTLMATAIAMIVSPTVALAGLEDRPYGTRSVTVFLEDDYSEVGYWYFYCDETQPSDFVGRWTGRQYSVEYGCPE